MCKKLIISLLDQICLKLFRRTMYHCIHTDHQQDDPYVVWDEKERKYNLNSFQTKNLYYTEIDQKQKIIMKMPIHPDTHA